MTQETTTTTSETAEENSSDVSVLDFLYHDSRRIGSFLSQFEGDGHLQQFTRTKSGQRGRIRSRNSRVKGTVALLGGQFDAKVDTSLSMNEGYSRVFDPYWANARAFLNHVEDHEMLKRDIALAEIGQFIIAKGHLSILDVTMLKHAWKAPSIQRRVLGANGNNKQSNMTSAQKNAAREEKENSELMLDMMQLMPHSVHSSLITQEESPALVWGSLAEEYLVTPASEIVLAHGAVLPGIWSFVGIMTALPDYGVQGPDDSDDVEIGVLQSLVGQISKKLAPIVRMTMGRPSFAYAVTPLLIFREVA